MDCICCFGELPPQQSLIYITVVSLPQLCVRVSVFLPGLCIALGQRPVSQTLFPPQRGEIGGDHFFLLEVRVCT